jgi:hypothetical protein
MTQRTWYGGFGDWFTAADWTSSSSQTGIPIPGDTLAVASGTITLLGSEAMGSGVFDNLDVTLGSSQMAGTTLDLVSAILAANFDIALAGSVSVLSTGESAFDGTLDTSLTALTVTLRGTAGGSQPGDLTILPYADIDVGGNDDTLVLAGTLTVEGITAATTLVNSGAVTVIGAELDAGYLSGAGTIDLLLGATAYVSVGGTGQTVNFGDTDATLILGYAPYFSGTVTGFHAGDTVDLQQVTGDTATYNAALHTLTLTTQSNGAVDATIANFTANSGSLIAFSDGEGGTDIAYASARSSLQYAIAAGDRAMGSDVVRATMTVPGTSTPITGAGVKIGIISDSFDAHASGSADPANTAAALGFIPANNGTSAVTVLSDYSGGTNEGLAMAELIHQVAPGATLDFASGDESGLAAAVAALKAAGCTIIVDDLTVSSEPVFQVTGDVDDTISTAIASGVDYFTSAGNYSNDYLEGSFSPTSTKLFDGTTVKANIFDNGTAYEPIVSSTAGSENIDLEWSAPFFGTGQTNAPAAALTMKLFNSAGTLVATSTQLSGQTDSGGSARVSEDQITVPSGGGTYDLAIYQTGTTSVSEFEFSFNSQSGLLIEDNQAGSGTGELSGQELIPAVNTVGAVYYASSPAFGQSADYAETFSDGGTGTLLYNNTGTAENVSAGKVDFVAPDGIDTSVGSEFAPFFGTSAAAPNAAAVAALMLQANPKLTTAQVTTLLEQSAVKLTDTGTAEQGAGLIQAVSAVTLAEAACYATGTLILTDRGEVPVEMLAVGDRVVSAFGGTAPIVWVGTRRTKCRQHPNPLDVMPVVVAADAFGPGLPRRDLRLSPDHAVHVDGVLIPVRHLVNDRTIRRDSVDTVTYWHIELPSHDAILAEGLPAETYLDTGNRASFDNGGGAPAMPPDFARAVWEAEGCADLVVAGQRLVAVRAALATRADALGHVVSRDPALRLVASGRVLPSRGAGRWHRFRLPRRATRPAAMRQAPMRLVSRHFVPAQLDLCSPDRRRLGVAVGRIRADGHDLALDDPRLTGGWHAPEAGQRWTDGAAGLELAGVEILEVEVALAGRYAIGAHAPVQA